MGDGVLCVGGEFRGTERPPALNPRHPASALPPALVPSLPLASTPPPLPARLLVARRERRPVLSRARAALHGEAQEPGRRQVHAHAQRACRAHACVCVGGGGA
jgi:hypothetical protein